MEGGFLTVSMGRKLHPRIVTFFYQKDRFGLLGDVTSDGAAVGRPTKSIILTGRSKNNDFLEIK
jgi:hypothetical protein